MTKRIEKIAKKQLDDNNEAVNAICDKYISSFECIRTKYEKDISEANLEIQKILTDVANKDSDEVIENVIDCIDDIDLATERLSILERAKSYLLEEIKERVTVQGLTTKQ